MKVMVEVSARHVHLTKADFAVLFGENASLTFRKALSQPGEFLSYERVDIIGPKRAISKVAVLGPFRKSTQVELSISDCMSIGQKAPIRESGDVRRSASIKLVGPRGELEIMEGLIVAKRHIHMKPSDAIDAGVSDKQIVRAMVHSSERTVIFDDVVVRVSPNYALAMHIDTDEGNAAGVGMDGAVAEILLPSI